MAWVIDTVSTIISSLADPTWYLRGGGRSSLCTDVFGINMTAVAERGPRSRTKTTGYLSFSETSKEIQSIKRSSVDLVGMC